MKATKRLAIAIASIAIGVLLAFSAYSTCTAIKVVGANAQVTWSESNFSRLLQYFSPSLGLPEDIVIQSLPEKPQQFVQALGQLPKTLRSATMSIGNDSIAPHILNKLIENRELSELKVHGCSVSNDTLTKITELPHLQYLAISGTDQSFHEFSPRSQVEALELDKTELDLKGLNRVLGVRTLKEFSMVDSTLDFNSLLSASWEHPSLRMLVLGYVGEVGSDQIQLLIDKVKRGCPRIEAIFLNNRNVLQ